MEKLINDFSFGLFFWQLFILIALIFLLKKYAWKPILDALNEREAGIKNALDAAEEARKEMQNLQSDNQNILNEARAQRDQILKEARTMKESIIAEAKGEAKSEADKVVAQAQAQIQSEKQSAIESLKNQVAGWSVDIAEKLLRKELQDSKQHMELVETLLDDTAINAS